MKAPAGGPSGHGDEPGEAEHWGYDVTTLAGWRAYMARWCEERAAEQAERDRKAEARERDTEAKAIEREDRKMPHRGPWPGRWRRR